MFCNKCGKSVPDGAKFCQNCGAAVDNGSTTNKSGETKTKQYYVSAKNRTLAIILTCLGLLGIAGIQRFYVGRPLTGTLYLLTCGVFFLGTIFDLIMLGYERFDDGDGYPLYSDGSMKSNYHRRELRSKFKPASVVGGIMLAALVASAFTYLTTPAKQIEETQEKQIQPETNDKTKKKEYSPLPIIDMEMGSDPNANINMIVEKNAEDYLEDSLIVIEEYLGTSVENVYDTSEVTINFRGARGLTINGTLADFDGIAKKEISALYQTNPGVEISNVTVNIYMIVTHADSSTGERWNERVLSYAVSMSKNRANKMYWENYSTIDITEAADNIYIHPLLQKEIQQNAGKSFIDEARDVFFKYNSQI